MYFITIVNVGMYFDMFGYAGKRSEKYYKLQKAQVSRQYDFDWELKKIERIGDVALFFLRFCYGEPGGDRSGRFGPEPGARSCTFRTIGFLHF